ncbi:hypothetical protein Tco_1363584 [Tanacetum coccineum]
MSAKLPPSMYILLTMYDAIIVVMTSGSDDGMKESLIQSLNVYDPVYYPRLCCSGAHVMDLTLGGKENATLRPELVLVGHPTVEVSYGTSLTVSDSRKRAVPFMTSHALPGQVWPGFLSEAPSGTSSIFGSK